MKENKIAVIGLSGESIFMKMDHFNQEEETVVADAYHVEYGGKGYNQAVAAKRYGANVSFLTVCGNDEIANKVEQSLIDEGINAVVIKKDTGKSASACIMIDKEGRNRVICYPGVSSYMTKDDVKLFENEIKTSKYLLLQLEMSDESLFEAIKIANKYNTLVILNPAPAKKLPPNVLNKAFIITPNEQEAKIILGGSDNDTILNSSISNIIVTKGEFGSVIKTSNQLIKVPARKVKPLNTTGAGDTYNGVLAAALLDGNDIVNASKIASIAASISVTKEFVIDSIPYRNEIK